MLERTPPSDALPCSRVMPRAIAATFRQSRSSLPRNDSRDRWEGFTWREIRKTEPEAARDRERGKWTLVPPGGESYVMLAERIRPWVAELAGDNVIVAHGGVARALMHLLAGVPGVQASAAEIWQGRVLVFEKSRFFWV